MATKRNIENQTGVTQSRKKRDIERSSEEKEEAIFYESSEDINGDQGEDGEDLKSFLELLNSSNLNPFCSWESQRDELALDDRYLSLDTNEKRAEAYNQWSAVAKRDQSGSGTERYLSFVKQNSQRELCFIEFRRKHYQHPDLVSCHLSNLEKERIYREYSRLAKKTPEARQLSLSLLSDDDPVRTMFSI